MLFSRVINVNYFVLTIYIKLNKWYFISLINYKHYHIRKNLVDFCFSDRSFSSIDTVISNFKYGKILHFFYKLFWYGNSETSDNYLKVDKILYDLHNKYNL